MRELSVDVRLAPYMNSVFLQTTAMAGVAVTTSTERVKTVEPSFPSLKAVVSESVNTAESSDSTHHNDESSVVYLPSDASKLTRVVHEIVTIGGGYGVRLRDKETPSHRPTPLLSIVFKPISTSGTSTSSLLPIGSAFRGSMADTNPTK